MIRRYIQFTIHSKYDNLVPSVKKIYEDEMDHRRSADYDHGVDPGPSFMTFYYDEDFIQSYFAEAYQGDDPVPCEIYDVKTGLVSMNYERDLEELDDEFPF